MLFEAHLHSGEVIIQTAEDKSTVAEDKNCFHDVLQRIDEVAFFGLYGDDHTYVVDLRDGHFEIDGLAFNTGDPSVSLPPDTKYRLIYFKRTNLHFVGMEQVGADVEYHIGWQTTVDGKNVQTTIGVR